MTDSSNALRTVTAKLQIVAVLEFIVLGVLVGSPPVLAAARTVPDGFSLGNTRDNVPIRLPLIEGKDIRFTHYSTEQGLSENRVDHMLQDAQGFLWFGTYNGLNRFDGYRFQSYRPQANNPNSLGGVMIYSLFQDRSGALWIAVDQGLDRFDPISQKFTHFYSDASDPGSPSGHVEHITQDRDGMLWLATRNGLDRLDPASLRFTHYRNDPSDPQSLASNDTRYVLEDRQGTLWVATAAGPDAFDRRTGKVIRHYPSSWQPPLDRIYEDRSGTLWLSATRRGGLISLDRKTGVFTTYIFFDEWPEAPGTRGCSAILEDRHGMMWLGTRPDGVVKFDRQRRQFTRYKNEPGNPTSLNSNEAISLVEDREGGIWVGTATGGVNRFPSEPAPFTIYRSKPGSSSGLDQDSVISVFKDSQGILWIATRQLIQLDRKTGRYTFYRHDPANPGSISADIVSATTEDRAGFLWVGTWGGGLNWFDRRTGRFRVYRHDPANSASLSNDFIMYLLLDREGNVWAGTEDGVNRLDARTGRFTVFRFPGPRDSRMYPCLAQDVDGSIWMGTYEQGLQHLDVESGKIVAYVHNLKVRGSLSNNRVNDLYVDLSGTLWVATQDGLDRFDRNTGEFTAFNERDGLASDAAVGLQEDWAGHLWVATTNGLSKFYPQSGTFKNYYASDGLAGNEFENTHVHFKSADGEMLFTGWNGITAFYPDRVVESPYVPPVILTDFRLFNKPVLPGEKSALRKSISYSDALTLSHQQNIFSIEFSSLSYANPQRNRYRYMLEGLEKTWNEVGSDQRLVTYTTLAPGEYVFRVQGSNNRGVWNEAGVTLHIHILPPWWSTWWFRVVCVAAFVALLWGLYQLRLRQLAQQFNMRLEERVGERTRIARDLHDTLLQSFHGVMLHFQTGINQLPEHPSEARTAEARETLEKAMHQAKHAIVEGREAIQGLRSSVVETNDLALAMRTLGEELAPSANSVAFQVHVEGTSRDLHPILRDEVYRITGEGIRNAFRHAAAKQIEVEIHYDDRRLRVRVRDDGKGIDPKLLSDDGRQGHFGLRGMRERAKLMGGKLTVWSELDAGTEVELSIPAARAYTLPIEGQRMRLTEKFLAKLSGRGTGKKP
ncbi:MAG TPA: two-component regulator propeller domain-containing protein [Candidatus Acidoferrum sp.]|nr:two-component regulator propeller domain-containing protein [Candidatus Acidoferrum sp.]